MLFYLFCAVFFLLYWLNNRRFNYWTSRNFVQYDEITPILGSMKPVAFQQKSFGQLFADVYEKFKNKSKIVGIYMFYRPALIVNDTILAQDILIRDFSYFHDRPTITDEERDPITAHLFNIKGQKWRDLRVKLSPTFTSGKLKTMFPIIKSCGQTLEDYLMRNVENKVNVFEFRDLVARLNTSIISSVAFGIDNDCINDSEHIFRKMGSRIFEPTFKNGIKGTIGFVAPILFNKLGFKFLDDDVNEFFWSMVNETVGFREKNNFSRPDFLQLLIQLKNQGYLSVDKNDNDTDEVNETQKSTDNKKLSMNQIMANVFIFFVAGFETSSSTASYCLVEITKNPEIQQKIHDEIDEILKETDGDLTYDCLSKFKYLEMCIDETLRKYPIIPMHFRQAVKDYKIKGSDLIIPKDTAIFIPVLGMQRDPDIYDDPMTFDPERFRDSPHGNGKAEGSFYTPFGDGPRNCIGMRLGKVMTKLSIIKIMTKFKLEFTDKSFLTSEIEFHPAQFILTPKKLFNFKLTMRK